MATDLGAAMNSAASIANAQNSSSWSNGTSVSDSWNSYAGGSQSSSYANSDAWSSAWSAGRSQSQAQESSRSYGREASAQDIANAAYANQVQQNMWNQAADYNAKQAQLDREFQEYMSNTAYQRAVADLMAAGLNPILAVQSMGASTPTGAVASMSSASAAKANAYAESESYGSSSSSSWNRSKSKSKSKSRSASQSSSYESGSGGSHSESANASKSKTNTQLKDMINIISDLFSNGGSASSKTKEKAKKVLEDNWSKIPNKYKDQVSKYLNK